MRTTVVLPFWSAEGGRQNWGEGEHCLSTWPRSGSCELRSRPILLLDRRNPKGAPAGAPFLGLLSFGETKESNLLPGNPRRFSTGIAALDLFEFVDREISKHRGIYCDLQ
ncbi:MAG TPA: hypothetical protein VFK88_09130 [Gallionella sp.]|nr:hypothetical protein [Gallionella sp.]